METRLLKKLREQARKRIQVVSVRDKYAIRIRGVVYVDTLFKTEKFAISTCDILRRDDVLGRISSLKRRRTKYDTIY